MTTNLVGLKRNSINKKKKDGEGSDNFKPQHVLCVNDLQRDDILDIIDRALWMKKHDYRSNVLNGKTIALFFEKTSTRTRISFEVAVSHLGGKTIYIDAVTTQMSRGEPPKDAIRVLNHYIDGLVVRLYKHSVVEEMKKYATMSIINGLTDKEHPCQAYGDLMTLKEFGLLKPGNIFTFVGDGNFNMSNSLMVLMAMFGFNVRIVCPEKYKPSQEYVNLASKYGKIEIFTDPVKGVSGSDVIYTDTWVSMGMESEKAERVKEFLAYQVNSNLLKYANNECKVMHCLPAYRGFEITDDVLEKNSDIIFSQASNRLHIQKALLEYIYGKKSKIKKMFFNDEFKSPQ